MYNVVKIFVALPARLIMSFISLPGHCRLILLQSFTYIYIYRFPGQFSSYRAMDSAMEWQGGLPATCDLEKLKEHFGQFGAIQDAVVEPQALQV